MDNISLPYNRRIYLKMTICIVSISNFNPIVAQWVHSNDKISFNKDTLWTCCFWFLFLLSCQSRLGCRPSVIYLWMNNLWKIWVETSDDPFCFCTSKFIFFSFFNSHSNNAIITRLCSNVIAIKSKTLNAQMLYIFIFSMSVWLQFYQFPLIQGQQHQIYQSFRNAFQSIYSVFKQTHADRCCQRSNLMILPHRSVFFFVRAIFRSHQSNECVFGMFLALSLYLCISLSSCHITSEQCTINKNFLQSFLVCSLFIIDFLNIIMVYQF